MKFFFNTLAIIIGTIFFTVLLFITGLVWVFWSYGQNLPDYSQLSKYEPPVVSRVYASDGALLDEFATEKRLFVPIQSIPSIVKEAFLSSEDKDFYNHLGLDFKAIIRAALTNVQNYNSGKRAIGASTITQQIAKNFLLSF
jgi:penicillin-binding protein 1A